MKILGIGNAIVDVICKVDDSFIKKNNLTKSTMKLFFDENEFKKLLTNLKIEKTVSGGSVANSIVGISQLGEKAGFIGKIADDIFLEGMHASEPAVPSWKKYSAYWAVRMFGRWAINSSAKRIV